MVVDQIPRFELDLLLSVFWLFYVLVLKLLHWLNLSKKLCFEFSFSLEAMKVPRQLSTGLKKTNNNIWSVPSPFLSRLIT